MAFKKGQTPWNKGTHLSQEHRKHLSEHHRTKRGFSSPMKGTHFSEEYKRKLSLAHKGQIAWNKGKKGVMPAPWNKGKKGLQVSGMKGKHLSKETKKKLSEILKGRPSSFKNKLHTKEAKLKNRLAHLGKPTWNKGKTGIYSEETLRKMSESLSGEKSQFWRGGKSFEPYNSEFNRRLKEQIRKRDGYRCQECLTPQAELVVNTKSGVRHCKLSIHHIDYDKKNNKPENLISLCRPCHAQTNFDAKYWIKHFRKKVK